MTTSNLRDHARALRYRQLALREQDKAKAALLNQIADEAERGVLVTAGIRRSTEQPTPPPLSQPFPGS
jgi:hypothetical protein